MRVLKKYPNRRIYDTSTSKFVAITEIRQMIIERESIQVLHSKTGEDLTRSVLMQILADMEQEGHASLLTNRVLEELIRLYGDKFVALVAPYLEQQILQSLATQDLVREHMTKAFTQPYATPEQAIKAMVDQYQAIIGQVPAAGTTQTQQTPTADAVNPSKEDNQ